MKRNTNPIVNIERSVRSHQPNVETGTMVLPYSDFQGVAHERITTIAHHVTLCWWAWFTAVGCTITLAGE